MALGYAIFRFFPVRREVRALRLERDGEKDVGQKLELLRKKGYEILHDIIGNGFNLDHVLIGPAGIFTVETKTHSKPVKGNPSILFDGDKIIVGGLEPERNPVVQAKAQASWLRELLAESTGRKFEVRPVIVYPGWFVENRSADRNRIWVLNPKGLSTFLDHEPMRLKPEDIRMASYHLDRFVRA
ncbi:MAG TPA: nuclease-related domain-containing protein [Candidatus Binatia bacterium]